MGKWLNRLNQKNLKSPNQAVPKVTKTPFGTFGTTGLEQTHDLSQIDRLQQQHSACLEVKKWPHYKTISPEVKAKGDEIIQHLALEVQYFINQSGKPL